MSSKADDFDIRYRDVRNGDSFANGDSFVTGAGAGYASDDYAGGGYHGGGYDIPAGPGSTVDYDLGYDAQGWDTQGFRRPEEGFPDGQATSYPETSRDPGGRNGRTGSHARTSGARDAVHAAWGAGMTGRTEAWIPGGPGGPAGPGGPSGPGGPGGPGTPGGPGGPGTRGPGRSKVKVKGGWWRHWTPLKVLGVFLGLIGAFVVLAAIGVVVAYEGTPVPTAAMAGTGYAQSVVYSSNGTVIGRFGTTDRVMLPLNQIPKNLVNAVLAIEDRHFWTEGGISPTGIVRAALADMQGEDLQGGSTITQEFVRQYYQGIGTQQTLSRKFKEIFVAMKIAKEKSKQWVMENYLNTIYLGEGSYGVEAAAETYFGLKVGQLSVAQDAVIAALIQQPSTLPLPQYRAQLEARWRLDLNDMVQTGTLSAQAAAAEKFPWVGDNIAQSFGVQPWDPYIMFMVRNELEQVYKLSWSQIYDGGYTIRTSIDDTKMKQLYQAVITNEASINASADPFESYMHVGAVLEDPATGAIQALYPGPGYPGYKYNGVGRVITTSECKKIACEVNMAVYNREQVGSSFKPYILATAVKEGMNVKTSTLYGFDNACIPPDSAPKVFPVIAASQAACPPGSYYWVSNDSAAENGPYTPQVAMAASINTAYTDLWHAVAGDGGMNVVDVAQAFGVDTDAAGITAGPVMKDQAGLTLGQASLTVSEQSSMLAAIDDNGVYHDAHVITSISRNGVSTPILITSDQVFNPNPTINAAQDSQVQYAMSEDTAGYGTAPVAAMSNGQEVIAKTGTTNTAQSAFFIGAIPSQALAVAIFTSNQTGKGNQTLNLLGGQAQGGYGGTWPATIWHTYAENMFVPLGVEQFQPVTFTGGTWNLVPKNLQKHPKKKTKNGQNPGPQPSSSPGNPNPFPTYTCDPQQVTCSTSTPQTTLPPFGGGGGGGGGGGAQTASGVAAGAAVGGVFAALPVTLLWVRRRGRRQGARRG